MMYPSPSLPPKNSPRTAPINASFERDPEFDAIALEPKLVRDGDAAVYGVVGWTGHERDLEHQPERGDD